MAKLSSATIRRSALDAADWFVNSQIQENSPFWDANAGRFIYNYHLPSGKRVSGLNWTQARGIMVLMAAHKLTQKEKYLIAAEKGARYIKCLQQYDTTLPYYGAFAEEIPQSEKCWPRDGSEAASGYLHLYNATGETDLVRRAALYGNWLISLFDKKGHLGSHFFFKENTLKRDFDYYLVGSGMFLSLLYRATGEKKYLDGLKNLADSVEKLFMLKDGTLVARHYMSHHSSKGGKGPMVVVNDDGLGAALLSAAFLLDSAKYLDNAVRIADWMMKETSDNGKFCSLPSRLCFLMDIHKATGEGKYRDFVELNIAKVLKLQILNFKDPFANGAFRGEDEPVKWYAGGKAADYVTTRVTCYAALTLFKLLSDDWTPGYSAFGWKKKPIKLG